MKKLLILIIIALIPVISFNNVYAAPADDACSGKKNGDACSYSTSGGRGAQADRTTSGFCDRNDEGKLYCNSNDPQGWSDCFPQSQEGDACIGETGGGRGGTARELGTCSKITSSGSPRSSGTTTFTCDTTKKPSGTPGGLSPNTGASPGGTSGGGDTGGSSPGGTSGGSDGSSTSTDASAPQTVGFTNPIRFNTIPELIAGVINALLGILGAITVAVLVMSGFKYMTSSNPGEVGQALDGIKNAVVGLIIIMGAFLITQYVISALAV